MISLCRCSSHLSHRFAVQSFLWMLNPQNAAISPNSLHSNDQHTNELQSKPPITSMTSSLGFKPKYKTMSDLNLPQCYGPIFSTDHLQSDDASNISLSDTLTKEEKETFSEVRSAISNKEMFPKDVIVRCAGGWIRDKLLQCDSDDIDLSVDTMTGEEFAECLAKYFRTVKSTELHIGKIEKNPDKSKHLSAATFKIGKIEFDVVNLRTETYTEDSRVPQIDFGTAKEDVFRRDLTINALFYNINEDKIEDLCGSGLADLRKGMARTPLDALTTFTDDPLRVLRSIRHGITKLGFALTDDIIIAIQNPKIHRFLLVKVSRERIGVEFEKMLKGKNVWIAMHVMVELGLGPIIFTMPTNKNEIEEVPKDFDRERVWTESVLLARNVTEIVMNKKKGKNSEEKEEKEKEMGSSHHSSSYYDLSPILDGGKETQKLLLFAAFTFPFRGLRWKKKKNRSESMVMYFVLHSMPGMPNGTKMGETASMFHEAADMFIELLILIQSKSNGNALSNGTMSLRVGQFLRKCKSQWKNVLFLVKSVCSIYHKEITLESIESLESWIETQSGLIGCWEWKPLLNGKEMMERYKKHGLGRDRRFGQLNTMMWDMRLTNPKITVDEVDEHVIKWLKENPPQPDAPSKNRKGKK